MQGLSVNYVYICQIQSNVVIFSQIPFFPWGVSVGHIYMWEGRTLGLGGAGVPILSCASMFSYA